MPWMAELVESSEGSLDVLPVQCLCEFLLRDLQSDATDDGEEQMSSRVDRHRRNSVSKFSYYATKIRQWFHVLPSCCINKIR